MPSTEDRRQWGRIGAYTQQAKHDPNTYTVPARRAFRGKFEQAARADCPACPDSEIARRAKAAHRAYMLCLAKRSADVRRKRAVA